MSANRELAELRRRVEIVTAYVDGRSVADIARTFDVSRPTATKWINRFKTTGVEGLLTRERTGRPRDIDHLVRSELVRLPKETRPPTDLGDQWTVRTLAEAFDIAPATVSLIWQEARFDPPLHYQQVAANPDRLVPLQASFTVPAWLRLHYELAMRDVEPDQANDALVAMTKPACWPELRTQLLPDLERRVYRDMRPRVDPRSLIYRMSFDDEG